MRPGWKACFAKRDVCYAETRYVFRQNMKRSFMFLNPWFFQGDVEI